MLKPGNSVNNENSSGGEKLYYKFFSESIEIEGLRGFLSNRRQESIWIDEKHSKEAGFLRKMKGTIVFKWLSEGCVIMEHWRIRACTLKDSRESSVPLTSTGLEHNFFA